MISIRTKVWFDKKREKKYYRLPINHVATSSGPLGIAFARRDPFSLAFPQPSKTNIVPMPKKDSIE
jgi:hypothetical protein